LYLYDLEGKQLAQLTKGEWEISAVDAIDESKGLVYFSAAEKSPLERCLYRVAFDGTGFTRLTKDEGHARRGFCAQRRRFLRHLFEHGDTAAPGPLPRRWIAHRHHHENKVASLRTTIFSPVEFLTVKSRERRAA